MSLHEVGLGIHNGGQGTFLLHGSNMGGFSSRHSVSETSLTPCLHISPLILCPPLQDLVHYRNVNINTDTTLQESITFPHGKGTHSGVQSSVM